ncbi:hypothetical protein GCM10010430_28790 [Kitasatospora cystarginea]|uniref:Uncharacterized protein n=1 Tax=Kitasatospora cystarginea TaxID=58350 RepID=A0ABP5QXM0_9ACTN
MDAAGRDGTGAAGERVPLVHAGVLFADLGRALVESGGADGEVTGDRGRASYQLTAREFGSPRSAVKAAL